MPKMSGYGEYVQTFKVKEKNNKLMSFRIDDKIEDLKSIKLNALQVHDYRCMKSKIRTFGDKVYSNARCLNVPEDDIECESSTVISIDSLLLYDMKYYMQVYLDNCAYKIVDKQMTDYLDENIIDD